MNVARAFNSSVFDEIAAVIGSDSAHLLCQAFGGTTLYIPKDMHADHPIARAIGWDRAQVLSRMCGSETYPLPKLYRRREKVLALWRAGGMTQGQIALATDYSERHVSNIIAAAESGDDRQGDLFSSPRSALK